MNNGGPTAQVLRLVFLESLYISTDCCARLCTTADIWLNDGLLYVELFPLLVKYYDIGVVMLRQYEM